MYYVGQLECKFLYGFRKFVFAFLISAVLQQIRLNSHKAACQLFIGFICRGFRE
jgi:hypothetical protein